MRFGMKLGALTLAMALLYPNGAMARSRSAELHLIAFVKADCSLQALGNFNLGTYESGQKKPLKVEAKVLLIACTKDAPPVQVALSEGRHFMNGHRHLRGPAPGHRKIEYEIYTAGGHDKHIWNSVHTVTYRPKSDKPFAMTMYAKVFPDQKVPPGEYHDHIVATVEF